VDLNDSRLIGQPNTPLVVLAINLTFEGSAHGMVIEEALTDRITIRLSIWRKEAIIE